MEGNRWEHIRWEVNAFERGIELWNGNGVGGYDEMRKPVCRGKKRPKNIERHSL